MSMWGLPTSLVHAVAFHHRPSEALDARFSPLTAVHCADALSITSGDALEAGDIPFDAGYLDSLGLSEKVDAWRSYIDEFRLSQAESSATACN